MSVTTFEPGRVLQGVFRLGRPLRTDAYGARFDAEDLRHKRPVSVTVLPADVLAPQTFNGFVRECQRLAQVKHPNVVKLRSLGRDGGVAFLVTDPWRGQPLRAHLNARDGRLGDIELIPIARQIASALTWLHASDLVHRELRAESVLVDGEGKVMLVDFGVARPHAAGVLSGVPGHMAPEQIAGKADATPKSDQYAFAVLCFEALTGRPPFQARTPEALVRAHLTAPRPFASRYDRSVSQALSAVLHRALSIDPEERFADVSQFFHALQACIHESDAASEELVAGVHTNPRLKVSPPPVAITPRPPPEPPASLGKSLLAGSALSDAPPAPTPGKVVVRVGGTISELTSEFSTIEDAIENRTNLYGLARPLPVVADDLIDETVVRPVAGASPAVDTGRSTADTEELYPEQARPPNLTPPAGVDALETTLVPSSAPGAVPPNPMTPTAITQLPLQPQDETVNLYVRRGELLETDDATANIRIGHTATPATDQVDLEEVFGADAAIVDEVTDRFRLEQQLKRAALAEADSDDSQTVLLDLDEVRAELFGKSPKSGG